MTGVYGSRLDSVFIVLRLGRVGVREKSIPPLIPHASRPMRLFVALVFLVYSVFANVRLLSKDEHETIQEQYILPNSEIGFQLALFFFMMAIFLYPPDFMVGIGATLENWTSTYLGISDPDIIQYQSRRIVVNRTFIGLLPFLFSVWIFMTNEHAIVFVATPTRAIHYIAKASILFMIGAMSYWAFHHMTDFKHLKAIKRLRMYNENLNQVYTEVATEMLALETFKHVISSSSRLIVTNTWLIFYTKFDFRVVKLEDVQFAVTNVEDIFSNPLNPEGAIQLITLKISMSNDLGGDIIFKLHNLTLQDLQGAITQRIAIPQSVVLKLSTVERFARSFSDEALKNPRYVIEASTELDPCLACSETISNMKINKQCTGPREEGVPACQPCNCRPMWCISCMGKVFAAKQDQTRPNSWLSGKAPCPTCRAIFCVFDISMVQVASSNTE